jgi:hypothetical protein
MSHLCLCARSARLWLPAAESSPSARRSRPSSSGWTDWPWGPPGPDFVTVYSGRVIANLEGPDGQRVRGRFQLNDPAAGMRGGGQGQCRLSDGSTLDAVFPRA